MACWTSDRSPALRSSTIALKGTEPYRTFVSFDGLTLIAQMAHFVVNRCHTPNSPPVSMLGLPQLGVLNSGIDGWRDFGLLR
jgi:hypothetical protein